MYANISRPVSQRFLDATSRSRAAQIATEVALSLAAFLRETPPRGSAAGSSAPQPIAASAEFILSAYRQALNEEDTPYRAPAEQPHLEALSAEQRRTSAAMIIAAIQEAP
jgi:hypothetical protein